MTTAALMPSVSACRCAKKPEVGVGDDDRRPEQLALGDPQQRVLVGRIVADQRQELLGQRIARHL
jgi:hypothetical protein